MKTFAFHSYKGGSGRSLALINFAAFLLSKGKTTVMVDLDYDAPGLAAKCGVEDRIRSGYIDFLMAAEIADRASGRGRETRIEMLQQYLIEVQPGMKLLPAGDPSMVGYWAHLGSEKFYNLFSVQRNFPTRLNAGITDRFADFKNDLEDIRIASGNPDFCLVDCKTAREPVAVPLLAWADEIVEFLHCNRESVFGSLMIQKIVSEERKVAPPPFTPVVARIPLGTSKKLIQDEIAKLCHAAEHSTVRGVQFPASSLQLLFEVKEIEIGDVIVFWQRDLSKSPLRSSYVELFHALTRLASKEELELDVSSSTLRVTDQNELFEKVFLYWHERGVLQNKDGERNIALREKTLVTLLNSLALSQKRSFVKRSIPTDERVQLIREAFERAGHNAGASFGREAITTREVWVKNRIPRSVRGRLKGWCAFDMEAGFGEWSAHFDPREDRGWVSFKNHFLATTKDDVGTAFVYGYIKGVLEYIAGDGRTRTRIAITKRAPDRVEFRREK